MANEDEGRGELRKRVRQFLQEVGESEHFIRHPQAFGHVAGELGFDIDRTRGFRIVDPEAIETEAPGPTPEETNRAAELAKEDAAERERSAKNAAEREALAQKGAQERAEIDAKRRGKAPARGGK